jgi:hypothetical protein
MREKEIKKKYIYIYIKRQRQYDKSGPLLEYFRNEQSSSTTHPKPGPVEPFRTLKRRKQR